VWYNLAVLGLVVGYFFVLTVLAGLPVRQAHRLQQQYHQAWLFPYTIFLASWGVYVLLAVVQYMLIGWFLPDAQWPLLTTATRPLFAIMFGVMLYALGSFLAQMTGGRLSRTYTATYVVVWTVAAVGISVGSVLMGERPPEALSVATSVVVFVFVKGLTYGWIAYALLTLRRVEDSLDRTGLRRFVLLQMGGFVAFDLVMRDWTSVFGVHAPDVVISAVQVGANYPALVWLTRFLRRRALARPADPLPADLRSDLVALGLSVRESEVVELLLAGLSHKEIAERLSISPDTVKKHTYNVHRKLGVQNRVQLSYFVQNRVGRSR